MASSEPFMGVPDTTVKVAVTTARQPTALKGIPADRRRFQARVVNKSGGSDVWLRFGNDISAVVAKVDQSRIIPAGNTEVFTLPEGTNCFDTITESGTATLYIETGEGL